MTPLLLPLAFATPLTKVMVVGAPKGVFVPVLFETVGETAGLNDESAPEKRMDLGPV
jgi:hypothetical protein